MKKVFALFLVLFFSQVAFAYNGDVNGDGAVTSADVTAIYTYILNGDNSSIVYGDVNGDGFITSADVTAIYNILLGNPQEHTYVDLGLPSGTLWATMNIGANSPADYGYYFAWGETASKSAYKWANYQWCNGGDGRDLTKYCTKSNYGYNGFVDNKTELDPEDDAATVNWGSEWRMPTKEQLDELRSQCTRQWISSNGVNGYLLTSKNNGASLFLPAAGYISDRSPIDAGTQGYYWSRTVYTIDPCLAFILYFVESQGVGYGYSNRYSGLTIRAVRVSQK